MKMQLCLGEESVTPFRQMTPRLLELMEKPLVWLRVGTRLLPSLGHGVKKSWDTGPEILKSEASWSLRSPVISKEKGAMV